jgi:hypothetical protein
MLAAAVFFTLCPGVVLAHSPSEVKLSYDMPEQMLQASITHTNFSKSHYVKKVEIRKNGSLINVQEYKNQPSENFVYSYKVIAIAGDTFEVKADCSMFGSKTEKLTIGQSAKPASK